MLFFRPKNSKKRGDEVAKVSKKAKEERFYLEREKTFQTDLKTAADEVTTLRGEVDTWYKGDGKNLLDKPITSTYEVNPTS